MRLSYMVIVFGLVVFACSNVGPDQDTERLNPLIVLQEQSLPIFGITHPAINAPLTQEVERGSTVMPLSQPALADIARETLAYKLSDFEYNRYRTDSAARFMEYMEAMLAAGGSMRTHAFISKIPIVHNNLEEAAARIVDQLNAGHSGIMMQEVESAEEVSQAIAAMRFRSQGGTRPEHGIGMAAAYWGLTEKEYLERADVWPLNPNGELVLWAIVESKEGIAKVREIAAVPGLSVLIVGAGTLGRVFTKRDADGAGVRDEVGFDAGVDAILAACREFKVACSHPANNPAQIESLMKRGFQVFTMQRRNQEAFDAVLTGRRLSGRLPAS